jgi:DNA-binding response OmpR family regulator
MSQRILVVDDEPQILRALGTTLRGAGFDVDTAATAEAALVAAAAHPPAAVILDLVLPDGSGTDVCRELRTWTDAPVIILSAVGEEREKIAALDAGADDYVTKPFSLRELSARIRALFRRADQAAAGDAMPAVVDLGRVQVDLAGHRLLRDGTAVRIKPKAFELLTFLLRHPGQAFTRDQLLEHVWGYDYAGETRTVDVHVHWLRSTLEDDAAAPRFIHTVRGVGYVFRRPA